jgi:glycosyltransferase involved in cell wall biosynthesis
MHSDSVSCLMVTANRPQFVERAIALFEAQTYSNRELVIIDDGEKDLTAIVDRSPQRHLIRYYRLSSDNGLNLGQLRNKSIQVADGDWCIQWDDDEWYHSERIERQLNEAKKRSVGSSALKWTLMHINESTETQNKIFRADTGIATPGTLLFRRDVNVEYRPLARNEDGFFMREVCDALGLAVLGRENSHLFIRVFHGANTWEEEHFMRRLHRRPTDWPSYAMARFVHKDITRHKAFALNEKERHSASAYLGTIHQQPLAFSS